MSNALILDNVVKTFGQVYALDGLNLRVETGEVHGFLGPNGAGKSTAMRVLLGLLKHDSGTAELLGGNPWSQAAELHRRIAYVPGDVTLWPSLTGGEIIDILGRMRGDLNEDRRAMLTERFQLDTRKKSRTYSKGNRQKVALVAAFASDADLYLLDEPTSGLDPLMEAQFQRSVHEAVERGATVLLSSHILAEVEELCNRVSIIRDGKTVQSGSLSELRHRTRTTVAAETTTQVPDLSRIQGVENFAVHGNRIEFSVESDHLNEAMTTLTQAGVTALTAHPPTLEELFMAEYGEDVAEESA